MSRCRWRAWAWPGALGRYRHRPHLQCTRAVGLAARPFTDRTSANTQQISNSRSDIATASIAQFNVNELRSWLRRSSATSPALFNVAARLLSDFGPHLTYIDLAFLARHAACLSALQPSYSALCCALMVQLYDALTASAESRAALQRSFLVDVLNVSSRAGEGRVAETVLNDIASLAMMPTVDELNLALFANRRDAVSVKRILHSMSEGEYGANIRPNDISALILLRYQPQTFHSWWSSQLPTLQPTEPALLNALFPFYATVSSTALIDHYRHCRKLGYQITSNARSILLRHCQDSVHNSAVPTTTVVPTGLRFFLNQIVAESVNDDASFTDNTNSLDDQLLDRSLHWQQILTLYDSDIARGNRPSSFATLMAIRACYKSQHWQRALQLLAMPHFANQLFDADIQFPSQSTASIEHRADSDESAVNDNGHRNEREHVRDDYRVDYWPELDEWNMETTDHLDLREVLATEQSATAFDDQHTATSASTSPVPQRVSASSPTTERSDRSSLMHYVYTIAAMDAAGNRETLIKADQLHAVICKEFPYLLSIVALASHSPSLSIALYEARTEIDRVIDSSLLSADSNKRSQARESLNVDRIWCLLFIARRIVSRWSAAAPGEPRPFLHTALNQIAQAKLGGKVASTFAPLGFGGEPPKRSRIRQVRLIVGSDEADALRASLKRVPFRMSDDRLTALKPVSQPVSNNQRAVSMTVNEFRALLHSEE